MKLDKALKGFKKNAWLKKKWVKT